MPRIRQCMAQRRYDQPACQSGIAKAHFGFGRVDVHIHKLGIAIDKERGGGMAVTAQQVEISAPQRPHQQLVTDGTPVHKQVLRHGRAARIGRQRRVARQVQPFAFGIDGQRVFSKLAPQHLRQTPVQRGEHIALFGLGAKHLAARSVAGHIAQGETHEGFRHRQPLDDVRDRLRLGAIGAQEFQPCGRGKEEIAQGDDGATIQRSRAHRAGHAAVDRNLGPVLSGNTAANGQPPDSPKRGQCFTAKTEGVDVQQVRPVNLRGRVPGQRQRQIVRGDAAAVVGDADQRLATIGIFDRDLPRARINCVLDQFLDRRGRAFNDLSGGDTVNRRVVELPDHRAIFAYIGVWMRHAARPSIEARDSESREYGWLTLVGEVNPVWLH